MLTEPNQDSFEHSTTPEDFLNMFRFAALFLIALSLVSNAQGQLLRRQQFSPSCPGGQCRSGQCQNCPPLVVQLPLPTAQPIPAAAQD
ncbi:MAG: hypothetical protein ACK53V_00970, partial [Planctomycetota bacterium]